LNAGESVHVSDLKVDKGIEIHESPDTVLATIVIVREEELEPQATESAEPEVVGKDSDDKAK
jgi:large subunit ribosomal protein L25